MWLRWPNRSCRRFRGRQRLDHRAVLDAYGGDIGEEVSRLIVVLRRGWSSPSGERLVPLAFVAERLRTLPVISAAALAAQVVLAWICSELFGSTAWPWLALSTCVVLVALLAYSAL
jgi:hypothetical protein